jgi:hypothetical protein
MAGPDHLLIDGPFGFIPYGPVIRANMYALVTNLAVATARGSLMQSTAAALLTPKMGYLQQADSEETGADGSIIGAVLAVFDHDMNPVSYLAAATVGDGVISGYALIADSPAQLYLAQEDGDTSSLAAADVGQNVEAIGTTIDTARGISLMEVDSSSKNTTSTIALKLMGFHPDDTIMAAAAAGGHARCIVKVASAYLGEGSANTSI